MIVYGLKIFKLVIIIVNISFYLGILWIIFCELNEKLHAEDNEYFLDYFNLRDTTIEY